MLFFFDCPKCRKVVKADSSLGGDTAVCPHCECQLLVPMDAVGPDTIVGGFHLLKKLGVGGMGDVYLAEQPSLKRMVALKVLPPAMTRKERFLDRFIQEIKIHGAIQHPNVATAYDAGSDRGIHYLAMEYVEGIDLNRKIEEVKSLPEAQALRIVREVALALRHAWDKKKIVHCDIKPGNVMLTSEGGVKVLDMGLSKSLVDMTDLTQTGYMVGTPLYMSPEQGDGSRAMDFRSDLYSLGSTLYHMVTGQPPFTGKTVSEVIAKRATSEARPARELNPDLTPGCENLLRRMLQAKPDRRFVSYEAFLEALDQVMRGRRIPAASGHPMAVRMAQVILGAVLLLACALIILSGKMDSPAEDKTPLSIAPVSTPPVAENAELARFEEAERQLSANPSELGRHLSAFETIQRAAREKGDTALARRAEAKSRELRERLNREVQRISSELTQQAEALMAKHDFLAAFNLVQNYNGPFRMESEKARNQLLQVLKSQRAERVASHLRDLENAAEKLIGEGRENEAWSRLEGEGEGLDRSTREERRALLGRLRQKVETLRAAQVAGKALAEAEWSSYLATRICTPVRKGSVLEAVAAIRTEVRTNEVFNAVRPRVDAVEQDLLTLARTDFAVLNTYTNDIGREVELQLVRGPVRVRIDRVAAPQIEATRRTEQGTLAYKWTVQDISVAEKWKRAESLRSPDSHLHCAQIAFAAGNEKAALAVLGKHPGELAAALVRQINANNP